MYNENRPFVVGIDFCNDFSQVSYYNFLDEEPVSVDFSGLDSKFLIPTVVCKSIGREEWFAGDEAGKCAVLGEGVLVDNLIGRVLAKEPVKVDDITVMPIELIEIYMDYLLSSARLAGGFDKIDKVCITLEIFDITLLNVIKTVLNNIGISSDKLILSCHTEAYIYYVLNMKPDIWKGDVALFDYGKNGLDVYRMYMASEYGKRIVMVHSLDFHEELPIELAFNEQSIELLDDRLLLAAEKSFEKRNVSAVYLTGKGFSDDVKAQQFLKYVCTRRRVFAGQNLYSKGACYTAANSLTDNRTEEFLIACRERVTTGIDIKISDRGHDKILRMVKPGINWYDVDIQFDFIVNNSDEIEIYLSPVDSKEKQVVKIPLSEFPERPDKATRITLSIYFTSDSRCHVNIKDRGFGEFFKSSGQAINREIML